MPVVRAGRVARPRARLQAALATGLLALLATSPAREGARPSAREARRPLVGIVDSGVDGSLLPGAAADPASRNLVPGEGLGDGDGHGTEMAWIVHRAAPRARIAVVKVVDRHGSATDARIAAAVAHLHRSGATVILLSLAGAEPLPRTRDAIEAASHSALVVVAAGNDGLDLRRAASYPASYQLPNLLAVAATDGSGRVLGTSNRGAPTSVAAPGRVATCSLAGEPVTSTGTSAAAAVVAGSAVADRPAPTVQEQVDRLRAGGFTTLRAACPSSSGVPGS